MGRDLLKLEELLKSSKEVNKMLEAIKDFNLGDLDKKIYLAIFTDKSESFIKKDSTMSTPFGSFPCSVSVPELDYEGGFEVEISSATCLRVCSILLENLNKQNKETAKNLKKHMKKMI